ncbi:MAG: hypothetical protein O3B22_12785 [Proteobacteria bacterium]|nr:hypothetical protein [Pseudomonadota bacterium]
MTVRHRLVLMLAAAIAAAGSPVLADELVVFRDTPTESEWQAVQAYFHDNQPESTKNMALLRLDDPVAEEDFYQLPNGVTLDLDEDGVQEHILAVGHPEACDREGCDVYLLEGDLKDLRIDKVLHLPLKVFGSTAIVFFGEEFLFLKIALSDALISGGMIGRESLWNVLERTYGVIEFERLDPDEMAFASIDLNGDWRKEVFFLNPPVTMLCYRSGCSTILSPDPADTSLPFPKQWTSIAPLENHWDWDKTFYVTPHMVRGWKVIRSGRGCYVWLGYRYAYFIDAPFRLIPVQGCFK